MPTTPGGHLLLPGTAALDTPDATSRTVCLLQGSDDYVATPDHSSLDITGDIDIRFAGLSDNWSTSSTIRHLVSKFPIASGERSYRMFIPAHGGTGVVNLVLNWSATGGTHNNIFSTVDLRGISGLLAGVAALRVTFDVDNGSSQRVARFYYKASSPATAHADVDSNSGWTLFDTVTESGATSIFAGTAPLQIGVLDGTAEEFRGDVYAVQIRNGIDGTVVADPDFTAQTAGAASFADSTGKTWTLNGNAVLKGELDVTADIDLRALVLLDDWTPAAQATLIAKWNSTAVNERSFAFQVTSTTGLLYLQWTTDGTNTTLLSATSSVAPTVNNGDLLLVAATLDVDDGSGNRVVKFYTKNYDPDQSVSAQLETALSTWTQLGTTQTASGTTSIYSGTARGMIGGTSTQGAGSEFLVGRVFGAVIKSGIEGATVANPDCSIQPIGTASFVDGTGKTWSLDGLASLVGPYSLTAPQLASQTVSKSGTSNASLTITFATDGPTGIRAGSLVLIYEEVTGGSDCVLGTTPAGWTKEAELADNPNNAIVALYSRIMDGTETTVVLPALASGGSATQARTARAIRIVGHHPTLWKNALQTTANATVDGVTPFVFSGVTTTASDCLIIHWAGTQALGPQSHIWSGPTEQWDFTASAVGDDSSQSGATKPQIAIGPSGSAWVLPASTSIITGITLAIAPGFSDAIAVADKTSGSDDADTSSYTTASITPAADSLILVAVENAKASNADTPTLSGCGMTWVQIRSVAFGTSNGRRITLFRGMSASPSAGALTIDFAGQNQTACEWSVSQFGGVRTGSNGEKAIRQSAQNTNSGTASSLTVTLNAISSARNVVYGAFGFEANTAVTPGAGFTERHEVRVTTPVLTLQTESQVGKDRTVDVVGTSLGAGLIAGIAVEIIVQGTVLDDDLTSGNNSTDAASYLTESVTPAADALQLLAVYNSKATSATLPTVTGCGLTWVQVDTVTFGTSSPERITLFRAMGSAPTTGSVTIDFGGTSQLSCEWSLIEFSHVDTSGTNGSGAVRQVVTAGGGTGTQTSLTDTLAAFGDSDNRPYGAFGVNADLQIVEGSGFLRLHEKRNATELETLFTEWANSADTTVDASWATASQAAAIAIEVVAEVIATLSGAQERTLTGVG